MIDRCLQVGYTISVTKKKYPLLTCEIYVVSIGWYVEIYMHKRVLDADSLGIRFIFLGGANH